MTLSKTLTILSDEIHSKLEIIDARSTADKQRKIRILEAWNSTLTPAHPKVSELDDYGKCVVHGYKSMINKSIADMLTYDDFYKYVDAVLTHMKNDADDSWNERRR